MLQGLRVVQITGNMAAEIAGLLLCELGADVLKIEGPDGDPRRGTASFANWNRGKRSLALELEEEEGRAALADRLADADVLIHSFTPSRANALGLDDRSLSGAYPRLVVSAITGSPQNHPDVERSDDELLVAARLGSLYENDGYRPGPIVLRYPMGSWGAAHLCAGGVIARLIMRLQTGEGGVAHTSILQGQLSQMQMLWARNSAGPMPNNPAYPAVARASSSQLFECQGGTWLQIMDPTQQFDYASMPTMWEVLAEGVQIDTPEGAAEAFKRRPVERWLADLWAADISAEQVLPAGEILLHEEVRANGYSVEVDDPALGRTIQPNVPFHSDAPFEYGRPAPRLNEGSEASWPDQPADAGAGPKPNSVLEGVRVVDFGMFLAGPMGTSLMGDLGANVIKVEPLTGDRLRFLHRHFQAAARSKRSLALDLQRPEATPILERLLKWGEVVHHNQRAKGANKLGLSEENIRRINPEISFSHVSAYGHRGARAHWPGLDSIFTAMAGWEFENAGENNPPIFLRHGFMDTLCAQGCFVLTMASIYANRAHGAAYTTQNSLLGAGAFSQGEWLIRDDGSLTETFHLTNDQTGFGPYHRIYECANGQWIAIAAHDQSQQGAVRSIFGADVNDFPEIALERDAEELLQALEASDVPSEPVSCVDAANRFFDDPLNRELNLVSALSQPLYGTVEQPGAFWNFGDTPVEFRYACPDIGQHTDEIMEELGFTATEIAKFREDKVIGG